MKGNNWMTKRGGIFSPRSFPVQLSTPLSSQSSAGSNWSKRYRVISIDTSLAQGLFFLVNLVFLENGCVKSSQCLAYLSNRVQVETEEEILNAFLVRLFTLIHKLFAVKLCVTSSVFFFNFISEIRSSA